MKKEKPKQKRPKLSNEELEKKKKLAESTRFNLFLETRGIK